MELLERHDAFTALERALTRASGGRGGVVVVAGEAGSGKTSVVRAFLDGLGDEVHGWYGTCDDLSTPRPLAPFIDMARDASVEVPFDPRSPEAIIDGTLALMRDHLVVAVIDDLQWADNATLDIVASIGRRLSERRGLLVVGLRSDELGDDHPLTRVLARLAGPETIRLLLRPLSIEALTHLIRTEGADLEPSAVLHATGGNPFYVRALFEWSGDGIPPTIRDVVVAKRRALPDRTRQAIDQLSVIPGEIEFSTLTALGVADEAIEEAERVGLLVATRRGVMFRHQLAQAALADALGDGRRRRHHRRALDALSSLDEQPARLVHHAVGAGDERRTIQHGTAAMTDARRAGAHREVIAHGRAVLSHADRLDRAAIVSVCLDCADAANAASRFTDAIAFAQRAHDLAADAEGRGRALTRRARSELMLGAARAARASAERAIDALGVDDEPDQLSATSLLAQLCSAQDDFDSGAQWGRRAVELATRLGDVDARTMAQSYVGLCRIGSGDQTGFDAMETALAESGQRGLGNAWRIANNIGMMHRRAGRLDAAESFFVRAEQLATDAGDFALIHTGVHIAVGEFLRGDWNRAEDRLRSMLRRGAEGVTLAPLLGALARLLARRGDDEARDHAERAWRIATASGESNRLASAGSALLELAWIDGDDARVLQLAELLFSHAHASGHHYLAAEARRYGARVGGDATWTGPSWSPALDAFADGLRGDHATAAERWATVGQPYEEALELTETGEAAAVAAGLELLESLGAGATAARVRRGLRASGRRSIPRGPQPATRANPLGLTRRQSEVLDLLAKGLTNSEIAAQLFVSVRTVDHHVSAILTRLDVTSRTEAVQAADGRSRRGDRHGSTSGVRLD